MRRAEASSSPPAWPRAVPALAVVMVLAAGAGGCAHIRKDLGAPLPDVPSASWDGPVHYSEVLSAYGPPSKISALPAGSVFLYEHVRIDERQWGLILPGDISKFFKIVYATSVARTDVATFVFNENGMLQGRAVESFSSDPGGGFAFTLIFKVKSLSDSDECTRSQEGILDWGMAMTRPLATGLNAAQSLDSGSRGLDIVRIDGTMGQRALELNPQH